MACVANKHACMHIQSCAVVATDLCEMCAHISLSPFWAQYCYPYPVHTCIRASACVCMSPTVHGMQTYFFVCARNSNSQIRTLLLCGCCCRGACFEYRINEQMLLRMPRLRLQYAQTRVCCCRCCWLLSRRTKWFCCGIIFVFSKMIS